MLAFRLMCGSRKNRYPHPMEGHWKFLGGGGVLKAKFLEEMYTNKLEFPGGRGGCKTKKTSMGGVWIFSGTHNDNSIHLSKVLVFTF